MRKMKGTYNYVDSSYLQLLIEFGILFLILVLIIYIALMIRARYHHDYYLIAVLAFLLVFAMTEPRLLNLMYTSFPLIVLAKIKTEKYDSCSEVYKFSGFKSIRCVWGGDTLC